MSVTPIVTWSSMLNPPAIDDGSVAPWYSRAVQCSSQRLALHLRIGVLIGLRRKNGGYNEIDMMGWNL
jgi:hypothetical protein